MTTVVLFASIGIFCCAMLGFKNIADCIRIVLRGGPHYED